MILGQRTLGLRLSKARLRRSTVCAAGILAAVAIAPAAHARDLYIDPISGSDRSDGSSPANAWRHAPGDVQAHGRAARYQYAAGDRLIFKGGANYAGRIHFPSVGTRSAPIELVGDEWPTREGARARTPTSPRSNKAWITAQMNAHVRVVGFEVTSAALDEPLVFSFAPRGGVTLANLVDATGASAGAKVKHHRAERAAMLAQSLHLEPFTNEQLVLIDLLPTNRTRPLR